MFLETQTAIQVVIDPAFVRDLAQAEIQRLININDLGTWWDMKRLEAETCRKRDWLIDNILLNPAFKEEMKEISNNRDGGRWMFRGPEMKSFLDRHFHHLNRSGKTG